MIYYLNRNNQKVEELKHLGKKDILVGIPSYKNERTIKYVVETVAEGLRKYFPDYNSIIVNSDGNSPDNTRKQVEEAKVDEDIAKVISIYSGISGKGSAFRNIFEIARFLGVKGCLVVDSDLRSITPEWVKLLLTGVITGKIDYVTPLYIRHKYDGTITNNLVYPLTRALYGYDIRQPIGGDFGFSAKLLDSYLNEDVWETDVAKYGIDIWMTTTAIVKGFRVGQAALGAKIHDAKDPAVFLAPMFRQVVGTCFEKAGQYYNIWKDVEGVIETPLYGKMMDKEPEPVKADYNSLIEKFKAGYHNFQNRWKKYLTEENYHMLEEVREGLADRSFHIPNSRWAHMLYDFLISYHKHKDEHKEILDSLTPLYFLRVADFMNESAYLGTKESEAMIVAQADAFLDEKNYLIRRWESEILVGAESN